MGSSAQSCFAPQHACDFCECTWVRLVEHLGGNLRGAVQQRRPTAITDAGKIPIFFSKVRTMEVWEREK